MPRSSKRARSRRHAGRAELVLTLVVELITTTCLPAASAGTVRLSSTVVTV
jgi:hypothetical protein